MITPSRVKTISIENDGNNEEHDSEMTINKNHFQLEKHIVSMSDSSPSSKAKGGASVTSQTTNGVNVAIPKNIIALAQEYISANVVLFSACQDPQKSAGISNVRKLRLSFVPEGTKGGACTSLFLQILYQDYKLREAAASIKTATPINIPPLTYGKVLSHMQQACHRNKYEQIPHLSSSRPLRVNKDPFRIVPQNYGINKNGRTGTKRALIIGINYTNTPYYLPECHNDCRNIISFLKSVHGFEDANIIAMMDDPVNIEPHLLPTRTNLLRIFRNFAMWCQEGDVVFLYFSGHGLSVEDESGDELDGNDEAIMPMDYMTQGAIIDDVIFRLFLIPIPKNVHVTALFDCCHSGTILDLPFSYPSVDDESNYSYEKVTFPHMHVVREYKAKMEALKAEQEGRLILNNKSAAYTSNRIPVSPMKHPPRGRTTTRSSSPSRKATSLDPSTRLASYGETPYLRKGRKPTKLNGLIESPVTPQPKKRAVQVSNVTPKSAKRIPPKHSPRRTTQKKHPPMSPSPLSSGPRKKTPIKVQHSPLRRDNERLLVISPPPFSPRQRTTPSSKASGAATRSPPPFSPRQTTTPSSKASGATTRSPPPCSPRQAMTPSSKASGDAARPPSPFSPRQTISPNSKGSETGTRSTGSRSPKKKTNRIRTILQPPLTSTSSSLQNHPKQTDIESMQNTIGSAPLIGYTNYVYTESPKNKKKLVRTKVVPSFHDQNKNKPRGTRNLSPARTARTTRRSSSPRSPRFGRHAITVTSDVDETENSSKPRTRYRSYSPRTGQHTTRTMRSRTPPPKSILVNNENQPTNESKIRSPPPTDHDRTKKFHMAHKKHEEGSTNSSTNCKSWNRRKKIPLTSSPATVRRGRRARSFSPLRFVDDLLMQPFMFGKSNNGKSKTRATRSKLPPPPGESAFPCDDSIVKEN